ncbi:MAG TPA: UDP-N-acetylglucosamine 2-epimerase (non-hydrolyzing) [Candidatus Omnitrophota bacterium]|nr:UDP-N-acetylglucosamine 2-epimerase (non-hydrolyzing) [Candidatus Omnitrophota bacterium]
MIKIVTILGARPQFIKAAALSRELSRHKGITEVLVHTGQHYDYRMSDVFFNELHIPRVTYNLSINGGTHAEMLSAMLSKIETVLIKEHPDLIIVYGDTNSTLAGALAAAKIPIPVAHIEAGLRSFDRTMPEEINRMLTDSVSSFLYCPTNESKKNLARENIVHGVPGDVAVRQVGDVMFDVFSDMTQKKMLDYSVFERCGLQRKDYITATIHRAGNTDNPRILEKIFSLLNFVAARYKKIVFPVHPRTQARLHKSGIAIHREVKLIPPVSYLQMLCLLKHSFCVMTDSGGVQKESFWSKSPCLIIRNSTEWIELVNAGYNFLIGTDIRQCQNALKKVPFVRYAGLRYNKLLNEYGNGKTAKKIVRYISHDF